MYPKKKQQNKNNLEIQIKQMQFFLTQVSKKIHAIGYAFDSYIRMKGDDKSLTEFINKEVNIKKNQENKSESTRIDSKSSKQKPVGSLPQDRPS
tara:strand:+ start:147 stop:428 length:282 start_codon:yes stop_codon:yes gene_type:complete